MDARASKLIRLGVDSEDAEALVVAGFDRPSKIRAAKVKDLEAVPGIGEAKRKALQERFKVKRDEA